MPNEEHEGRSLLLDPEQNEIRGWTILCVQFSSFAANTTSIILYLTYFAIDLQHYEKGIDTWDDDFYLYFNAVAALLVLIGDILVVISLFLSYHCCWQHTKILAEWNVRLRLGNCVLAFVNLALALFQLGFDGFYVKSPFGHSSSSDYLVDWTGLVADFAIFGFTLVVALNSFVLLDNARMIVAYELR